MGIRLHRVGQPHPRWQHPAQRAELGLGHPARVGETGRAVSVGEGAALGIVKGEEGHVFPKQGQLVADVGFINN